MMFYDFFLVDSFVASNAAGNPAAVCILPKFLPDSAMQVLAAEINYSETAFVVLKTKDNADNKTLNCWIRWFTPKLEVSLCGHATLAAAAVVFNKINFDAEKIIFWSKNDALTAERSSEGIALDFPLDQVEKEIIVPDDFLLALGLKKYNKAVVGKKTLKLVIEVESEDVVKKLRPNFELLKKNKFGLTIKGVGVTARGDNRYHFVTRYFNPWAGVDEDPVTGSVHTLLASYWQKILGFNELWAFQASARGGEIILKINNAAGRVKLVGKANVNKTIRLKI